MGFAQLKDLPEELFAGTAGVEFSPSAEGDFYDITPEEAAAGHELLATQQEFRPENLREIDWSKFA